MGWEDLVSMFQPQQRDTGYQGYFDNYMNSYAPQDKNYFFDMNDPEVKRYQDLSSQEPRSKGFIEDYLSRRPSLEDYKPSLGRKLGAFALGALSGLRDPNLAYTNAQRVRMDPYVSQLTDWQGEGQGIKERASALDKAQANELGAAKFGLVERAKAAQQARMDASRTLGGATRFSGSVVSGQNAQDRIENDRLTKLQEILLRTQTQEALDRSRRNADEDRDRRFQFDREKFEWEKTHPRENSHDSRMSDPTELLKQRAGAESLAIQDIMKDPNNRVFLPIIEHMKAAREAGEDPMAAIDSYMPPEQSTTGDYYGPLRQIFKDLIRKKAKIYMEGR